MFTFIKNLFESKPQLIKIDVGDSLREHGSGTKLYRCTLRYDDNTTKYRELTIEEINSLQSKLVKF